MWSWLNNENVNVDLKHYPVQLYEGNSCETGLGERRGRRGAVGKVCPLGTGGESQNYLFENKLQSIMETEHDIIESIWQNFVTH